MVSFIILHGACGITYTGGCDHGRTPIAMHR